MRARVSLPDDVFTAADALAGRLGVSRSELYGMAVAEFVARHTDSDVTGRLDRLYSVENGSLDPELRQAQSLALGVERW